MHKYILYTAHEWTSRQSAWLERERERVPIGPIFTRYSIRVYCIYVWGFHYCLNTILRNALSKQWVRFQLGCLFILMGAFHSGAFSMRSIVIIGGPVPYNVLGVHGTINFIIWIAFDILSVLYSHRRSGNKNLRKKRPLQKFNAKCQSTVYTCRFWHFKTRKYF